MTVLSVLLVVAQPTSAQASVAGPVSAQASVPTWVEEALGDVAPVSVVGQVVEVEIRAASPAEAAIMAGRAPEASGRTRVALVEFEDGNATVMAAGSCTSTITRGTPYKAYGNVRAYTAVSASSACGSYPAEFRLYRDDWGLDTNMDSHTLTVNGGSLSRYLVSTCSGTYDYYTVGEHPYADRFSPSSDRSSITC